MPACSIPAYSMPPYFIAAYPIPPINVEFWKLVTSSELSRKRMKTDNTMD
tara:strand:+ start:4870 stop:5019 length:150 start_codon:yes stop_codon:yes gene_type:complete